MTRRQNSILVTHSSRNFPRRSRKTAAGGERGLGPEPTYRRLISEYQAPWPQAPLNREARLASGFSCDELSALLGSRLPAAC